MSASRSSGVRLLVAFGLAICSFIAGSVVSEHEVNDVHARTREISGEALPSIIDLASLRTDLFNASLLLEQTLDSPPAAQAPLRKELLAALARAHASEESYRKRVKRPGEQALADVLQAEIGDVEQAFDGALGAHSSEEGREELERRVRPALDHTEATAFDLLSLNSAGARVQSDGIEQARVRSKIAAYSLDAMSAIFTLMVAVLVVRTVRRDFESQAAQQRLISARAEELEAFAGRVAHDILNPLAAIGLTFDMLLRGLPPVDAAARGKASVARTRRVVDALLAFARAGARPEPGGRCEVQATLGGLLEDLGRAHSEARLRLEAEAGFLAACPSGVLNSIVGNLVGNGIKYADGTGRAPEVEVRARVRNGHVRIEVEDNGTGIPPEIASTLFQPFVRGHDVSKPGIGLGLATAKRLCEAHGGHIGFRSKLEVGTTFWVDLPEASPLEQFDSPEPADVHTH